MQLEKGGKGSQQKHDLDGVTVVMKQLCFDVPSTTTCLHTHYGFGLHFVLKGDYEFNSVNSKTTIGIKEGSYNLIHWPKVSGSQKLSGLEHIAVDVFFTKEFLENLLGQENCVVFVNFLAAMGKYPKCLWGGDGQSISNKLRMQLLEILQCPYTGNTRSNYLGSQMRCLIIDTLLRHENCIGAVGDLPLSVSDYEAIEKVISYINQNLKQKLTIKELSEIAGFNTTKLKSCFKKIHHTTTFKYITQLRMEKAKGLVLVDNLSIAQASYEVGYSNPQHFTVAFKKTMGYLPSKLLDSPT
ncbi:AraC family transcriptional regulator [Cellulophaga sp. F20128]|uniref:helix-turn-helix domain-containing protein n=1 Tax=Cellulophaga sp. F20128 TaxID=2926413 RepID=UPI001FF2540A|nr:AraC family transcriptional regulator [Cellulophaga sp. F20128]MCK0156581.1 AraC family transcriptional regulator [Cellulophaga sp. F20128]